MASSRPGFLDRFREVIGAAGGEAAVPGFRQSVGGEKKNGRRAKSADLASSGVAIQNRHLGIHENDVVGTLLELLNRLRAVLHFVDDAGGIFQVAADKETIFL